MDRASLEQLLSQGLSLAEIGRRLGLHESTVAYWLKKHGLEAVHRQKHLGKGGLGREQLESLVTVGMSTGEIAAEVGRSKTTVRHWLREYGLKTVWAERRQVSSGNQPELKLRCRQHGMTTFRRRSEGGYRCVKCRSEAVSRRRRKVKRVLVEEAGGKCAVCGYGRSLAALEFHHVEPADKRFALSLRGVTRSIEKARAEARKCVLLCANCHAEVECGALELP